MDDLISKQDAVNTSLEFFVEFLGGALRENAQKELITRFQRLPSVHPELDEWCTDCKEYDHEKHCCPRYNRVIREALGEIQSERKSVIYYVDGYSDGCMMYDTAECPSCGYMFDEEDSVWKEPFCPHCGQKLEW